MTPDRSHPGTATAGRIAVLGERSRVAGYALAGAVTLVADDPAAVTAAWQALDPDVAVIVLTAAAASALGERATSAEWPLVAVMPQ